MSFVTEFIDDLAAVNDHGCNYVNFYRQKEGPQQHNLRCYLDALTVQRPRFMLVGEAPGHRGCAQTGIPFTCPVTLDREPFFAQGSFMNSLLGQQAEQSAVIVWQAIKALGEIPLCWNAFPFHPHQPESLASNRPPNARERAIGRPWLARIIANFQPETIVAVGRQAEKLLQQLSLPHITLRHPARGGKNAFLAGMHRLS